MSISLADVMIPAHRLSALGTEIAITDNGIFEIIPGEPGRTRLIRNTEYQRDTSILRTRISALEEANEYWIGRGNRAIERELDLQIKNEILAARIAELEAKLHATA